MERLTIAAIAKMIDHSILHPTYSDHDLIRECKIARLYKVAAVCVKPYHVTMAAELMKDSGIAVCSVIGFPHGNSTIAIKLNETEQVINDGAIEVDMVVNIGKVLQEDWEYIGNEISQINQLCVLKGAILKVIFENDFLPSDNIKIKLCELCNQIGVAFIKTSTGYGFRKNNQGTYFYEGATDHDLQLMRKHCIHEIQIKAAGGIRTLDDLLKVKALGVTRVGATATEAIILEARRKGFPAE